MFRFTKKPSSGSHCQYLAKITHLVQSGYVELVQDVISVIDIFVECNWVNTQWQWYSTHNQYIGQHK